MNEEIARLLDREQLVLASKQKRIGAYLIDEIILSVLLLIIIWDSFHALESTEAQIVLINSLVIEFMAIKIIYHTFFTYQYGASPGKIVMKIRVLELSSVASPSLLASLNRAFFRGISEMLFFLGFLWGLLDPQSQTWHDKTARTVVVDA